MQEKIKSFLKNNWFKIIVLIIIIGFILFVLIVRTKCFDITNEKLLKIQNMENGEYSILDWQRIYNFSYQKCLNSYGL